MTQYILSGDRRRTIADVTQRAQRAAGGLKALGIGEDDVIALLLRNDFAFFEAQMAASTVGAYATPINWHATPGEIDYILADSGAKALIGHADLLAKFAEAPRPGLAVFCVETPPEIAEAYDVTDDQRRVADLTDWDSFVAASAVYDGPPAVAVRVGMVYTSGTTGRPKGVRRQPMSPEQLGAFGQRMAGGYGLSPAAPMTVLMNGPMYHSAPGSYVQVALKLGASIVLEARFDPEEMLALIAQHRITHMHIVPTMFHRLLSLPEAVRARYDLSSLVDVVHGAAPCPPAVKRAMIDWWGPVISEYYGSTETAPVVRLTSVEAREHPGSVGRALPGCELIIMGPGGERVAPRAVGDIYVRNVQASQFTYHGTPGKRTEIERDGFITCGDVGYMDADGFLYLSDRKNDLIISAGVNIYPAEIEAAIMGLPGVRDCAVFGGPDPEFGECVIAHIEPQPGQPLEAGKVRLQLAGTLAKYKIPRIIEFSQGLPREDSGKIFKRKLREPYWAGLGRSI
jgi:long-chain acyl-CoA synthetase